MRKKILFLSFVLGVLAFGASAASIFDIEFPVAELGNCADKAACKAYCDEPANSDACFAFAKKFGLVDESTTARVEKAEAGGPGGCKGADQCREYCDDQGHEDECVEYAVQNGFMTKGEAERARKPGPGGCRGKACQVYCEDSAHQDECFEFAANNGFIPKEEVQRIKEFKSKFKRGDGGPGGCKSEEECRNYCNDPAHIDQCLSFAEKQGFVSKEDAVRVKKAGFATGPGGCKGEQCRQYCEDPAHHSECIEYAEKNGLMSPQEAARAKKFAGKAGPGGCQGDQCRDFCEKPENAETCLEHAAKEGLMPKEELERARKFLNAAKQGGPGGCQGQQCRDYCNDTAHREECFSFAKNQGLLRPEDEEDFQVGQKLNKKLQESGGPGGCKSEEECKNYCTEPSHAEECVAFAATHGGVSSEQARRMVREFTERRFEANSEFGGDFGPPEDFRRFEQGNLRRFEEFKQLEEQFRGKEFPGFGPPGGFPGPGEFPGRPGEFPGRGGFAGEQGGHEGGPGGPGFVGPGGCTSPQECIKYCAEHRDECFGGGQGPQNRSGAPVSFDGERGIPQLRSNLLQEFKEGDLPQDFHQKSFEERQQFFQEKFGPPPGSPGQFPGNVPQEFPGGQGGESQGFFQRFLGRPDGGDQQGEPHQQGVGGAPQQNDGFIRRFFGRPGEEQQFQGGPQEFPGKPGQFEGSREFPGGPGAFPGQDGSHRFPPQPGQFQPGSEGTFPHPPEGNFQPSQGFNPPPGDFHPPEGFAPPPSDFQPQQGFTPPPTTQPSGSFEHSAPPPPPPSEPTQPPPPPPSSSTGRTGFFASILEFFQK